LPEIDRAALLMMEDGQKAYRVRHG